MNDRRWLADLIVWLIFAVVTGMGLLYHDMWRDEWQAILLSYKSHSIFELWNNTRDEGHPMLWYILLYIGKYLGPPIILPKLINYFVALGYALILLRCAPFKKVVRYVLIFGYLFVFEYGTISRNYAVSILLIVAIMAFWPQRHKNAWTFGTLLFLLTQSTIYGSIMALSFSLVLISDTYIKKRKLLVPLKDVLFILIGISGSILCFICASRVSFDTSVNITFTFDHFLYSISTLYDAYLPIPEFSHNCWNSIIPDGHTLRGLLGIILFVFMFWTLRKHKVALLFWVSFTVAQLTFTYIYFIGYSRQMGYLFIAGVMAFWFVSLDKPSQPIFNKYQKIVVSAVLIVQALVGLYFIYDNISLPFTESYNVAEYLKATKLAQYPIYGSYHYCMTGIAGYINKPIIHLDDMHAYTYMPWKKLKHSREQQSDSFLKKDIPYILSSSDSAIVLITYPSLLMDSLTQSSASNHFQLLQTFNNSNEQVENFNVYLFKN